MVEEVEPAIRWVYDAAAEAVEGMRLEATVAIDRSLGRKVDVSFAELQAEQRRLVAVAAVIVGYRLKRPSRHVAVAEFLQDFERDQRTLHPTIWTGFR